MGRTWVACSLLWFTIISALPAWAGSISEPIKVGPVLVSPRRIPALYVNASEFPGNATLITSKDIRDAGASTIPELLNRYEGVITMDSRGFGLGADSTVNLRGVVNSSRTNALVLLNGVRQNRITGDEVHWQAIPINDIERIEIIRGAGSSIYGEGALSGLISITTKKGAEKLLETEENVEMGTFGQRKYSVAARGRSGPLSYGTGYNRSDIGGYREDTDSRTTTITSYIGLDVTPRVHLETNILHSEDTTGFAGGITPEASQQRRRQTGSLPGFFDDESTQVSLDTIISGPLGLSLVSNAFWRFRESDSVTSLYGRFATITPSRGLSIKAGHEAGGSRIHHTIVAGIDLLDEKASTGTRGSGFSESNKQGYGLFMEETLRFMERVSVVAGVRFDKSRYAEDLSFPAFVGSLRFEGWSPKIGVSVDVLDSLTAFADFARPFKAPNVDDFSVAIPSGGFFANIDLQPQQGREFELGLRLHNPSLGKAQGSVFFNRIDDEILFNDIPGSDTNENFDTKRFGLELSASPKLPIRGLSADLNYTFLDAEFRKATYAGNSIPGVPEHRFSATLSYRPIRELTCWLSWLVVHDFYRINDFSNILPGDNYGVLNAGVRANYGENVSVYFKVENVTGEEYTSFQSSNGVAVSTGENPSPPRTYLMGLTIRL